MQGARPHVDGAHRRSAAPVSRPPQGRAIDASRLGSQGILNDFVLLREAGLIHPLMNEVEDALAERD